MEDGKVKFRDKNNGTSKNGLGNQSKKNYENDGYGNNEIDELKAYADARKARLRKIKSRRRKIIFALLIVLALILVWLNWGTLAPSSVAETVQNFISDFGKSKYPVFFEQGSLQTAVPMNSNTGVLTDTSFLIYSKNGVLLASRPHGFNDPCAVSGGGKAVIFDRGGKQFKVETRLGEPFSETASDTITTAAAGDSGNFAIVTESQDYLSELSLYDSSYKNVFKWQCAQGRILSAAISPDGHKLAAVVVGARSGVFYSDIYIFNTNNKNPVAVKKYDGETIFSIRYKDNTRITAVGEDKTVFLSSSGSEYSTYAYNDKTLDCCTNTDGPTVLVFSGVNGKSAVVSLDGEGKLLGQSSVDGEVKSASVGGGHAVLVTHGNILYSNENCSQFSKINVSGEILEALPINNYAYIFGTQSVARYDIK